MSIPDRRRRAETAAAVVGTAPFLCREFFHAVIHTQPICTGRSATMPTTWSALLNFKNPRHKDGAVATIDDRSGPPHPPVPSLHPSPQKRFHQPAIHGNQVAGGFGGAVADQPADGFRAVLGSDAGFAERALRVELRQFIA